MRDYLVTQALSGDQAAYRKLYEIYHNRVYTILLKLTKHREDAEDLLQNTFVKAFSNLSAFRGEAAFGTWLHTIAFREFLMEIRKRKKGAWKEIPLETLSEIPTTASHHNSIATKEVLEHALNKLNLRYQFILSLVMQGYQQQEIAAITRCSILAAKAARFHSKKQLREAIKCRLN